ncbi:MAG: hypothetical protein GXO97_02820 [Nitrospirae bacterium]|nr:hypothetical protein [Nitrospirota bacterium]
MKQMKINTEKKYLNVKLLLILFILTVLLSSCVGNIKRESKTLALVNGYPITEDDMAYALEIEHRREDLSKAGRIDLRKYLNRLIDERLLVEEAERMGIDKEPWIKEKLRAFTIRESVMQLYQDEIASKVTVTKEEAHDFYKKNYVVYRIGVIDVSSEEVAKKALKEISEGKDFADVVNRYSLFKSMEEGGVKYTRLALRRSPEFEKIVLSLKPGEVSGIHKINNRFYIVKLIEVKKPEEKDYEKKRQSIMRTLKKEKEKALASEYLKRLKEKAKITVDRDLLSFIEKNMDSEELLNDKRPLAKVNDDVLTVSEFAKSLKEVKNRKNLLRLVNNWIERKLVDQEALSRKYYLKSPLKEKINRYKEQLMRRVFIGTTIVPDIKVDDGKLKDFYNSHRERYRTPAKYKIQQITLKDRAEAEAVLKELREGADFSWVAMNKSRDAHASNGGVVGWFEKSAMPEKIQKAIEGLNPGDISPIIKDDDSFIIVKLMDYRKGTIRPFEQVKSLVYEQYMNREINKRLKEYVAKLRKDATIEIIEDNVRRMEERFR